MTAHDRLAELYAKIDALFAQASERHPAPAGICCRAGCTDCCRGFSITAVEAAFVQHGLASLSVERRTERLPLAARPEESPIQGGEQRCPALDGEGSCAVYCWRPAICRTHGLAVRLELDPTMAQEACDESVSHQSVRPPRSQSGWSPRPIDVAAPGTTVGCCPHNFRDGALALVDPTLVVDQRTLSTMLAAIDALYAREQGQRWEAQRVPMSQVLRQALARAPRGAARPTGADGGWGQGEG